MQQTFRTLLQHIVSQGLVVACMTEV